MPGTSFLSLPRELRDEIYKLALPPRIFRLTFFWPNGSLRCATVALPLPEPWEFKYELLSPMGKFDYYRDLKKGESSSLDVLPLLLSCRLVYHEVVGRVYSINTFRFHQADLLPSFFSCLPYQGLASITSLEAFLSIQPGEQAHCLRENTSRQRESIEAVLSSVERLFPRLRKLYLESHPGRHELRLVPLPVTFILSLADFRRFRREVWEEADEEVGELVELLDKFAAKVAPRLEFEFAPQAPLYTAIEKRLRDAQGQDEVDRLLASPCFRREVPSGGPELPQNPWYWISNGSLDTVVGCTHRLPVIPDE